jgi:site-specific DNA recombinase
MGFLLSGLLRCGCCNHNFTMANATSYGCSTHVDGKARANDILVRRDHVESTLLAPIRKELLSPERVRRMAEEMQRLLAERVRERAAHLQRRPASLPSSMPGSID